MQSTSGAAAVPQLDASSVAQRPRSRRPVDLVHLARHTFGNRALEREVLELFATQSRLYMQRLEAAIGDKAWRDAAHTIKGSARAIGAWQVAQSAEAAEALQGESLARERQQAVALLAQAVDEANAYIREVLVEH